MKRKKNSKTAEKGLQKPGRGRPPKIPASEVVGRADHYRDILQAVWEKVWPPLSTAESKDDVIAAIERAAPIERGDFTGHASLLLEILNGKNFPKRRQARINFLADSLAARGVVTPRRSRDICAQERAKAKGVGHIIRFEFYVECSCGYRGHSWNHACLKCGAPILQLGFGALGQHLDMQYQNYSNED